MITCGYTETNCALFVNSEQVASGGGLPSVPLEAAPYSAVVIGSSLAGDEVAMGEIDEFAAFSGWNQFMARTGHEFGLSEFWSIENYYTNEAVLAALGPVSADAQSKVQSPSSSVRSTSEDRKNQNRRRDASAPRWDETAGALDWGGLHHEWADSDYEFRGVGNQCGRFAGDLR
jgi:hypothetical protein